jgi:calcium-dependent protein kinase
MRQYSNEIINCLIDSYRQLDTDNDGILSMEELKQGIQEIGEYNDVNVEQIMNEMDTNQDGQIDLLEFVGHVLDCDTTTVLNQQKLKSTFDEIDSDRNGYIDRSEMISAGSLLNRSFDEEQVEQLFEQYDVNGDGLISFSEFIQIYTTIVFSGEDEDNQHEDQSTD